MRESFNTLPEPASSISLREYGDVLRRRRAIILQTFVIVLVAGVLVTLFTTPTYKASARLLLQAPSYVINQVTSSDPLADLMRVNSEYSMGTQIEMLQTSEIMREVSQALNNQQLPMISVSAVENTQILQIDAEGSDRDLVAEAPNKLMDIYCAEQKGTNGQTLTDAVTFAKDHLDSSLKDLNDTEAKLRDFQTKNNIQEFTANRDAQMRMAQNLSGDLMTVRNQLSVLRARMDATRAAMRQAGATKNPVLSPLADPAISNIESQLTNVQIQLDTMYKVKGGYSTADVGPVARLLKEQTDLVNEKVKLSREFASRNTQQNPEYQMFANNLLTDEIQASELAVTANQEQQQYNSAAGRLAKFPTWESKYEQLSRLQQTEKNDVDRFTTTYDNLQIREKTEKPGATIMEKAVAPLTPIRPKTPQNIAIAALLGLFLGLCLALLQELFDDRINNPEEAERVLRLPTLGHIPMIEEEGLRLIRDISTFSPLMEAYRTLRTNINFAAVGGPLRSLLVTSSVPAEGKSTTAANLAMAMALDNKRVIVVDADLRRPSVHKLFKKDSSPGLTDFLVGTHTMDEVIRDTNVPGVRVIPAGSPPPNPAELLGSAAMGHLLALLEENCDIVLLDSPPTLAVADAVVLASRVDGVILLVGYGETKKTSSRKAIEILSRANANLLGVVLNRIEGPSSGYYYGKYYVPAKDRSTGSSASVAAGSVKSSATARLDDQAIDSPMIAAPGAPRDKSDSDTEDR